MVRALKQLLVLAFDKIAPILLFPINWSLGENFLKGV